MFYPYRVYILSGIDGIGKHNKQNIDCEFNDQSFDLRILSFNGKNWRLKIAPLNGLIDPAACKLKVKSNSITLELKKAKSRYWDDVKENKKTGAASSKGQSGSDNKGDDTGANLMSMMKDMYE